MNVEGQGSGVGGTYVARGRRNRVGDEERWAHCPGRENCRGAGSMTLSVPRKWSRPGVVDVRCAVRAAKSCRGAVSLTLSVPRKLVAVRGRGRWARAGEGWRRGRGDDFSVELFVSRRSVQTLMSARGRVERSAPPVRVHNLSKTWLRRLPGAAAGAAPGPLDRLQGQGVSQGGFDVVEDTWRWVGPDEIRAGDSDEIRARGCWIMP